MSIDKSLNFKRRVGLKGGADASQFDVKRSEQKTPNVSAGGASFNDLGREPSGQRYQESRQEFVDNLNKNNASRFEPSFTRRTYKPVTLDTVGSRNQLPNIGGGIARLIKFALGIPNMGGLTSLGNKLGDFREKYTGYRTQEEYDNARQQRINLGRINTIQNTLNRKYSDGDYSNTDLDERLAALRSQMGIVPNTSEQNAQQFLDFGNELAENTQQTIFPAPIQNVNARTYPTRNFATLGPLETNTPFRPDTGINTLRFPEFNPTDTQVTPQLEYSFASTDLPNNNLLAKVSAQDLARYSQQKDLINQQPYEDAMGTTLMGSEMSPYEYEQLQKGNITLPGTYIG